jgi:hypothetical protein
LGSLELHAPQAGIVIFRDISGKEAYRTSVNIGNNRVDCSNLQAGIYVLSLQYGETRQQIKLIKM